MRHLSRKVVLVVAAIAAGLMLAAAQAPAQKPQFEVASIKPNTSGENRVAIIGQPSGRFMATNVSLTTLMGSAYRVRDFQIIGGPNWMRTDRWNIEAKAEEGTVSPPISPLDPSVISPQSLMLQSLIEDRFQLKMHRESRELPVYELVVAKDGAKIKLSIDQGPIRPELTSPPPGGAIPQRGIRLARGDLEANGVPIATLVVALSQQLVRTVLDKTDLKGLYDFKLQWAPELAQGPAGAEPATPSVDSSGPSIFTAIQEQLGLRLESAKGAVEVLVIGSVQKPSEN